MTLDPGRLRDRLRGIISPSHGGAARLPAPPVAPPAESEGALEQVLGGEWREAGSARSFVVRRRYDADTSYGRVRVGDVSQALRDMHSAAALVCATPPRPPFVFFDLETTGLSGGAGTHAFLVGFGWFDADAFVCEQHLMTGYAGERGMLAVVADELSRAGALVTYNGKSFDAPVIETRYLFHRLESPCGQVPHLDVLHPARRFWGSLGDLGCSLIALEQHLLGARRTGDVPGFEIPARYFQFVRTGDAQPLADVLEHNRLDLLSLAGVTARMLTLLNAGADGTGDAREALALGRIYERAGEPARAEAAYERVLALTTGVAANRLSAYRRTLDDPAFTPSAMRVDALRALAVLARRSRRHGDAAVRWRQVLEVPGCAAHVRREAAEALAIHHEHRERDLSAARLFALQTLEAGAEAARGDAVRHRLARIERKMVSERPLFPSSPLLPSSGSPTSGRRTSS
jgi:uncharacterized protein YprB with RNaseH-like and TPR domain